MATIHHQVLINAPVEKVYQAISTADGIGTWWDKQTRTETDRGPVLEHNPGPEHGVVKLRVVELVPNQRIEWECISTHPKSSPASALASRKDRSQSSSSRICQAGFPSAGRTGPAWHPAWSSCQGSSTSLRRSTRASRRGRSSRRFRRVLRGASRPTRPRPRPLSRGLGLPTTITRSEGEIPR